MPTATDPARGARPNPRPVTGWVRSLRSSARHLPADRLSTGPGLVVTIQGCGWRLWRGIETCRLRRAREASGRAPAELRRADPRYARVTRYSCQGPGRLGHVGDEHLSGRVGHGVRDSGGG